MVHLEITEYFLKELLFFTYSELGSLFLIFLFLILYKKFKN